MSEYTLLRIWGYHINLNKFLDDFANYTVEQDYYNVQYIPGKGYVMSMLVYIKETKYLRIDKVAKDRKVAYCAIDGNAPCAPSNTKMSIASTDVLAVLAEMDKAA